MGEVLLNWTSAMQTLEVVIRKIKIETHIQTTKSLDLYYLAIFSKRESQSTMTHLEYYNSIRSISASASFHFLVCVSLVISFPKVNNE